MVIQLGAFIVDWRALNLKSIGHWMFPPDKAGIPQDPAFGPSLVQHFHYNFVTK